MDYGLDGVSNDSAPNGHSSISTTNGGNRIENNSSTRSGEEAIKNKDFVTIPDFDTEPRIGRLQSRASIKGKNVDQLPSPLRLH